MYECTQHYYMEYVYSYTRLVSDLAPSWSYRCCCTACHFEVGKLLGRNAIKSSPIGNEPN